MAGFHIPGLEVGVGVGWGDLQFTLSCKWYFGHKIWTIFNDIF